MILHKALVILSVIFDTIICIDEHLFLKECKDFLSKVGLRSDSGLYNVLFFLQFKDETELMKYVESMVTKNDLKSSTNYDQTINNYLNSFYKNTIDVSSNNTIWRDISKTPNEFCISLKEKKPIEEEIKPIKEEKKQNKKSIFRNLCKVFKRNLSKVFKKEKKPIEEEKKPIEEEIKPIEEEIKPIEEEIKQEIKPIEEEIKPIEEEKKPIDECRESILNYKLTKGDKQFKYNENCGYKCFLTSLDIELNRKKDDKILKPMQGAVCGYFNYHLDIFNDFNEELCAFTAHQLCTQFFSIENYKASYLQKNVIKNEEENH